MFCSGVFVGDYIQFSLISGESRDAGASEDPLREAFSHRRAPAGRRGGLRVWRSLRRHTERPRPGMVNQSFQLISFQKRLCLGVIDIVRTPLWGEGGSNKCVQMLKLAQIISMAPNLKSSSCSQGKIKKIRLHFDAT